MSLAAPLERRAARCLRGHHSANADIPGDVIQAGLEVVIKVDPDRTLRAGLGIQRRIPATGRMAIDVVELPGFPLTLIRFLHEPDPDEAILDIAKGMAADPENQPMLAPTRDFLPVGEWDVELHDPVLTSTTNGFTIRNETEMMRRMVGHRHMQPVMHQAMTTMQNNESRMPCNS